MTEFQLPPDVIGHMAGIGGTTDDTGACDSCTRAVVYATLMNVGAAGAAIEEGDAYMAALFTTRAVEVLITFARADFVGQVDVSEMSDEEVAIAFDAFWQARIEHYVDMNTGEIRLEPHTLDGEPLWEMPSE